MAYFQKISSDQFTADGSFLVNESRGMHLFIAFLAIVLAGLFSQMSWLMAVPAGLVGLLCLVNARRRQTVMTINKQGFFYYGTLITNWHNFVSARFIDELPVISQQGAGISDKYFLRLRYYKAQTGQCVERSFRFTNTQDKSEEEVMAAIKFYFDNSK